MSSKNRAVVALALTAIAVSLFFLIPKPTEKAERSATDASEALGLRAGEEVAQLLGQKGSIAMLEMQFKPGEAPTAVATVESFRQTLKKHGVSVARTKAIPGGLNALVMGVGISWSDFLAVMEDSPKVEAVVTFAGLPKLAAEDLHQFQGHHLPLVVVDIFGVLKGPLLPSLVEQKTVALALVPRSATEVQEKANEPRLFERYYRILAPPAK